MKITLPIADIYDKLTILNIKKEIIKDERLNEIIKEINILENDIPNLEINQEYYSVLKEINHNLFNYLDEMYKIKHDTSNPLYSELCKKSFIENDRRFRMKRKINHLHDSVIKEVKSYKIKTCIFLNNPDIELSMDIIDKIKLFSTYYDKIFYLSDVPNPLFYEDGSIFHLNINDFDKTYNEDDIVITFDSFYSRDINDLIINNFIINYSNIDSLI
jgi:hypothetical protein